MDRGALRAQSVRKTRLMDTTESTFTCWDLSLEQLSLSRSRLTNVLLFTVAVRKGSLLSNPVNSTKLKIHDATIEHGFIKPKTVQDIIRKLRVPGDVLFLLFALRWRVDLAPLKLGACQVQDLGRHHR